MKTTLLFYFIFSCSLLLQAQEVDYAELGKRIAKTSASIKPGDVVVVAGGKHTIELMEAIAIEAEKQGGLVQLFLNTDAKEFSLLHDVSNEYLGQDRTYFTNWFKEIDVWIGLPNVENFEKVYKDVSDERYALARKANETFNKNLNHSKVRGIFVTYPTSFQAANAGLDFETFQKMQWAGVDTDYNKIAKQAKQLEKMLMQSKEVKITTVAGTNLTFSVNGRTCFIDDGIVTEEDAQKELVFQRTASLPGGKIMTTVIEDSAEGKVVVSKTTCNYELIKNLSFEFKNGMMQNLQANDGQDCMMDMFNLQKGDFNKIAGFTIGLNPALKVMQEGDQDLRWGAAAGMVYLAVGDNTVYNGNNKAEGQFIYDFPLANATVSIDGVVVVEQGKLQL